MGNTIMFMWKKPDSAVLKEWQRMLKVQKKNNREGNEVDKNLVGKS